MASKQVLEEIRRLRQWQDIYPDDYIRRHFIIYNDDGAASALINELARLLKERNKRGRKKGG